MLDEQGAPPSPALVLAAAGLDISGISISTSAASSGREALQSRRQTRWGAITIITATYAPL